jgi:ATP-dependent helicase/nuclease subunit A
MRGRPAGAIVATTEKVELPSFLSRAPVAGAPARRIVRPSGAAEDDEPALLSPIADLRAKRFRRGLLVHSLLAMLPAVADGERETIAATYLRARGLDEMEAVAIVEETLAVLRHPEFAPLFGPQSRGEITITADLPELGRGVAISGQIDRIAIGEEILIADFKTNRPPPKSLDDVPALYRAQMALYRAAIAKLYPGRPVACVLIWTDGTRLMRLPDSLLDAEIARIREREMRAR